VQTAHGITHLVELGAQALATNLVYLPDDIEAAREEPMSSAPRAFYEADSLSTEIYDVRAESIIPGSPVDGDVEFYRHLAGETGGPVLEVGCGTARVASAIAADGHEIVGVDLSAPMLRLAEKRREALPADVAGRLSFQHADMATLALDREFALIVTPSRVFQFLLTTEAQRKALAALRRHLRADGLLVLDLFDPLLDRVLPTTDPPPREGEVVHPVSGNRVTWSVTGRDADPARQLIVEDWTALEIGPSGEVLRTDTERLTLRWSLRSELLLLFELADLEVVAEYGDFRGGPPAYGREQVWVLRKGPNKTAPMRTHKRPTAMSS
jgi:SAM-dependent methyltransferase